MDRQTNGQWTDRRTDKLTDRRHRRADRVTNMTDMTSVCQANQSARKYGTGTGVGTATPPPTTTANGTCLTWDGGARLGRGDDMGEMVSVRVNGFLIAGGRFKSRQCNLCCFFWGSAFTFLFFCFCFLAFFTSLALIMAKSCHIAAL